MKTPQQIKNEVELLFGRTLKAEFIDDLGKTYPKNTLFVLEPLDIVVEEINKILTEYDNAMKEMILKWLNANTKGLSVKTREEFIFSYNDILEIIDELILSKIGDNSEVKE